MTFNQEERKNLASGITRIIRRTPLTKASLTSPALAEAIVALMEAQLADRQNGEAQLLVDARAELEEVDTLIQDRQVLLRALVLVASDARKA